tara:strand:+ start:667 stop:1227 length:561 start_codon:yes stop_codon:yes gene_type:complete
MIFIGTVFYSKYFKIEKTKETVNAIDNEILEQAKTNSESQKQDNIIKNLRYNVDLLDSGKYEIKSDFSEITILAGAEIVKMKNVTAIFTDVNENKLYIYSDFAEFNSKNYNTSFKNNIKIRYLDHVITSKYLDFDFIKNNILVRENVEYYGNKGQFQTDNIKIDLLTKNVEIFMNEKNKNIKIISF